MRNAILLAAFALMSMQVLSAQTPAPTIVAAEVSKSPGIPKYVLYRHFLGWVNALLEEATLSGATDPYNFAEPFAAPAKLNKDSIDRIRSEAQELVADLQTHDAAAFTTLSAYRAKAIEAAKRGEPLPPVPATIYQLQQTRTSILVQHFAHLQQKLEPEYRSRLDLYLNHEFTPHISQRMLAKPKRDITTKGNSAPF